MVRQILLITVLLMAIGLSDRPASACGDKFLVLGRSVGYRSLLKASKPGSVLLYKTPNLPEAFAKFDLLMNAAGHHFSVVADPTALDKALASGKVDLVLADAAASRQIGGLVSASSNAMVVPIGMNTTGAERAAFEKEFGCMLRLPATPRGVIDTLDKAMKLRAKRVAARVA